MSLNKAQLTALLADLQARVELFKSFEKAKIVNKYCDDLETQATYYTKAAIAHLNHTHQEMLDEIKKYRRKLLLWGEELMELSETADQSEDEEDEEPTKATTTSTTTLKQTEQELKILTQKVEELGAKVTAYFESKPTGQRFTKKSLEGFAQEAQEYLDRCKEAQENLKVLPFNHRFLKFEPKKLFTLSDDHVGTLKYSKKLDPETKDIKLPIVDEKELINMNERSTVFFAMILNDGYVASCACDEYISFWDPATGEKESRLLAHAGRVTTLAQMPNGDLVSAGREGSVFLWDNITFEQIKWLRPYAEEEIHTLLPLPNEKLVVISEDDFLEVWDPYLEHAKCLLKLKKRGANLGAGLLSTGLLVTSFCNDREVCVLKVWNLNTGRMVKQIPTKIEYPSSICVLSSDDVVVGSDEGELGIFSILEGCLIKKLAKKNENQRMRQIVELPNGLLLVGDSGRSRVPRSERNYMLRVWNPESGQVIQSFPIHSGLISSLRLSKDKSTLVTSGFDETIKLWKINY